MLRFTHSSRSLSNWENESPRNFLILLLCNSLKVLKIILNHHIRKYHLCIDNQIEREVEGGGGRGGGGSGGMKP